MGYTTFSVADVRLEEAEIGVDGRTRVVAKVTNTGARTGTEVVQMYVRDRVSSVTRPVKELKGFRRVMLAPGETASVAIDVGPEALAFHGIDMRRAVEPGEFEIRVGRSSRDEDLQTVILRVTP
ncbi:MAG TPA: fibronectin type III-like domain-contianing protein [Longimicrobium sp.]|nr:fibronectin type III-like domain-contianing protein [Longimicrobium sp.]